jgi:phosphopantothenoylcysteine decarboxylase/phosphopantothenate--cysteine ligase
MSLVRNPDVLQHMGKKRKEGQTIVGFSLEVDNALDYAREKLERKNCDIMIVTTPAHFGDSREAVRIINSEGVIAEVPPSSKTELAERICALLADKLKGKTPELISCFADKQKPKAKPTASTGGGDS